MPLAVLAVLVALYASQRSYVLSLAELNDTAVVTATLALIATGQAIVVLSGGVDLSVGGVVSLTTVIAATQFGDTSASLITCIVALLVGGFLAGAANGLVIAKTGMQPFIVTLASWSIYGGLALLILPTTGGTIPTAWIDFGSARLLGLETGVWVSIGAVAGWALLSRLRRGVSIKAVGSSRDAARLSGVPVTSTIVVSYALSGLCAAAAGLFLVTLTASGSPISGNEFILPSIAAVVIGGAEMSGGRASGFGAVAGAYALTLVNKVIFAFGIPSGWRLVVVGLLLLSAVRINAIQSLLGRLTRGAR